MPGVMRRGGPAGWSSGARNRSSAQPGRDPVLGTDDHAARRGAVARRGDAVPRVGVAVGRVAADADADTGREQRAAPPEVGKVVGVDVGEVLIAAGGDERWLGDDNEAVAAEGGDELERHDRAVLDAVARARRRPRPMRRARTTSSARVTQCTATGRPARRARRNQPTSTSSGGSRASSRTTLTGPRGQTDVERRRATAAPVTATCSGNPSRPVASASRCSSSGSVVGVMSVTPVMPRRGQLGGRRGDVGRRALDARAQQLVESEQSPVARPSA